MKAVDTSSCTGNFSLVQDRPQHGMLPPPIFHFLGKCWRQPRRISLEGGSGLGKMTKITLSSLWMRQEHFLQARFQMHFVQDISETRLMCLYDGLPLDHSFLLSSSQANDMVFVIWSSFLMVQYQRVAARAVDDLLNSCALRFTHPCSCSLAPAPRNSVGVWEILGSTMVWCLLSGLLNTIMLKALLLLHLRGRFSAVFNNGCIIVFQENSVHTVSLFKKRISLLFFGTRQSCHHHAVSMWISCSQLLVIIFWKSRFFIYDERKMKVDSPDAKNRYTPISLKQYKIKCGEKCTTSSCDSK